MLRDQCVLRRCALLKSQWDLKYAEGEKAEGSGISPVEEKNRTRRLRRKSLQATAYVSQPQRDRGKKQDLAIGTSDAGGSDLMVLPTCSAEKPCLGAAPSPQNTGE